MNHLSILPVDKHCIAEVSNQFILCIWGNSCSCSRGCVVKTGGRSSCNIWQAISIAEEDSSIKSSHSSLAVQCNNTGLFVGGHKIRIVWVCQSGILSGIDKNHICNICAAWIGDALTGWSALRAYRAVWTRRTSCICDCWYHSSIICRHFISKK